MDTKMGMREFKVIYTADQKRRDEVLIVATCALDAKQRAWHLLRMNGVPNPHCIKAIDNSKPTSGDSMHYPNYTLSAAMIVDSLKGFADMSPEETLGDTLNFKVKTTEDLKGIKDAAVKYGWSIEWNCNGRSPSDKRADFMDPRAATRSMTSIINLYCTKTKSVKVA